MIAIEIEGYLLQSKLECALKQLVGEANWKGREVQVPNSRRRWDMAYCINEKTTVVEFDGDKHYWNSLVIKSDREKDAVATSLGYEVIRIPYWIQLTSETALHYFGIPANIVQCFPHGFIDQNALLPASFSELGVKRFLKEISELPESVKKEVTSSLKEKSEKHGVEYVLPTALRHLIN